jgi:hypothetical protein
MRVSPVFRRVTAVVLVLCAGHCFADMGLVAQYTFAEDRGDTAVDSSGNGNDGTIVDASRPPASVIPCGAGLSPDSVPYLLQKA